MGSIKRGALVALVGLLGALGSGCSSDSTSGTAQLSVIHASADAPAVDIYAQGNTTPLFTNVRYGDSKGPVTVPAGSVGIEVRAAGSSAASAPVYTVGPVSLARDAKVVAIAAGKLQSTDAADRFRILPLVSGFGAKAAGKIRARIVHAGADAPTVGIDVGDDGSAEVPSLARFADTGAAGVELPAATSLQVGIRAGSARVTGFTVPALPEGTEVYVVATGLLAELPRAADGFALLAAGAGFIKQNPTVYALHASPDAPAVDIYTGTSLLTSLSFGELSAAIQVPPGSYPLSFFAAGSGPAGTPAATATTPALAAGERYLAIATGFLAGGTNAFQLQALAEGFDIDASNARLRVVHASPDAPMVDVGVVSAGTFTLVAALSGLSFGQSSAAAGAQVPAAALTLGVAAAGATTPVAEFDVTTVANLRAFAVAAGALAPSSGQQSFRILAVDTSSDQYQWTVATVPPNP